MVYTLKVLFVTNYCPSYRLPLFEGLSKLYQTQFIFTEKEEVDTKVYGNLSYTVCTSKIDFVRLVFRGNYDIIIINFPFLLSYISGLLTFLATKIRRKTLIFWVEEWTEPVTTRRKLVLPILKYLTKHGDSIVVCGVAARKHMMWYGASSKKIFVAPDSSFVKVPSNVTLAKQGTEFVILFLGRLVEIKGIEYLIQGFAKLEKRLKNVRLVIVGEGPLKDHLKNLTIKLGIKNVEFGVATGSARVYYYVNCDLFVLPSVWLPDHCEAWGMVLNEAMQFGKPVIATDAVGAVPDLVRNGVNGFVVKNSDSEALYEAMKRLAENPELAKRMGEESQKIVNEEFTYEKMVQGFSDAITFVTQKKGQYIYSLSV
jgi:glycosyltransferase involved in cell wall biosynthesis